MWLVWLAVALADPDDALCTAVGQNDLPAMQAALDDGADAAARCSATETVRADPVGDVMTAILMPPLLPFRAGRTKTRTVFLSTITVATRANHVEALQLLLDAGAPPPDRVIDDAIVVDGWEAAALLLEAGADPHASHIAAPFVGDPDRLARATGVGIELDQVSSVFDRDRLVNQPDVLAAFLDAGLPVDRLAFDVVESRAAFTVAVEHGQHPSTYRLLEQAVSEDRWDLVDIALDGGISLEPSGDEGGVLHDAARRGKTARVRELHARGALLDRVDNFGDTPMAEAAGKGHAETVALLLELGARPSGLDQAIREGDPAIVGMLCEADPTLADDPDIISDLVRSSPEVLAAVLEAGLDPNTQDAYGHSLLVSIIDRDGPMETLNALVEAGAALDGDTERTSPLQEALDKKNEEVARHLVELGADPAKIPDRDDAWDDAKRMGKAVETWLFEVGLPPTSEQFLDAVERHDLERVRFLLDHGAATDARDSFHTALTAGFGKEPRDVDLPLLTLLLEAGADPNEVVKMDKTAVHLAWEADRDDVIALFVEHGGDLDRPTFMGVTLLGRAAEGGKGADVERLVALGADPNAPDKEGMTPLCHAVTRQYSSAVEPLLAAGADPTCTDNWGKSALELTRWPPRPHATNALVDAGVSPTEWVVWLWIDACDAQNLSDHRDVRPEIPRGKMRRRARKSGCEEPVFEAL